MLDVATAAATDRGELVKLPPEVQLLLDTRPELTQAEQWVLKAFDELSTNRSVGLGLGPIPSLAVDAWCTRHGLDDDVEIGDLFRYLIRMLDRAWRTWHAKHPPKSPPPPPSTPAAGAKPRRRFWGKAA